MDADSFLLGGAQRSGTTLLYLLLDQHPEIEMARPLRPEPKFFLRPEAGSSGLQEYRTLFHGKRGSRVLGEKSTSYMERPDIAERVLSVLPAAKVVFLLRDPVERAISNYRFSVKHGAESLSLERAILEEDSRRENYERTRFSVSPFAYSYRGHYHGFIEKWVAAIGRERIHLVVFERLIADAAVAKELFRWLGVYPHFEPTIPPLSPNRSTTATDVPAEIRRHLAAQFQASNRVLRDRYGVDISLWQAPGEEVK